MHFLLELSVLVDMISDCSSALLQSVNFYLLPFLPLLLEPLVGIDSDLTNYNTLGIRLREALIREKKRFVCEIIL